MIYGCIINDVYLMISVTLGLPINFFAMSSALRILGSKKISSRVSEEEFVVNGVAPIDFAWQIELVILCGIALWILVGFIAGAILPNTMDDPMHAQLTLVGNTCCVTSVLYYVSPLSVLLDIVRKRDASGLHMPMIGLNILATSLWSAYGLFYMEDVNVYVPNILALTFSLSQLAIKFYFPSNFGKKQDDHYHATDKFNSPMEEGLSPIHHTEDSSLKFIPAGDVQGAVPVESRKGFESVPVKEVEMPRKSSFSRYMHEDDAESKYQDNQESTTNNPIHRSQSGEQNSVTFAPPPVPHVPLIPPPPTPAPIAPVVAAPYPAYIMPVEAHVPFDTSDELLHAENIVPLYAPPPPPVPPPTIIELFTGRSRSSTHEDSQSSGLYMDGVQAPYFGVRSRSNTRNSQQNDDV